MWCQKGLVSLQHLSNKWFLDTLNKCCLWRAFFESHSYLFYYMSCLLIERVLKWDPKFLHPMQLSPCSLVCQHHWLCLGRLTTKWIPVWISKWKSHWRGNWYIETLANRMIEQERILFVCWLEKTVDRASWNNLIYYCNQRLTCQTNSVSMTPAVD